MVEQAHRYTLREETDGTLWIGVMRVIVAGPCAHCGDRPGYRLVETQWDIACLDCLNARAAEAMRRYREHQIMHPHRTDEDFHASRTLFAPEPDPVHELSLCTWLHWGCEE